MRKLVPIAVVILLYAGAGLLGESARRMRSVEAPDTPGSFAATVLLSAGRPLAVTALWLHAEELMQAGRYNELPAVYETIVAIQPHFEAGWEFQAYNFAFRLSALESSRQKKWQWIREALLFIREGIEKNPDGARLRFYFAYLVYVAGSRDLYFAQQIRTDTEINPEGKEFTLLALELARDCFSYNPLYSLNLLLLNGLLRGEIETRESKEEQLELAQELLAIWRAVHKRASGKMRKYSLNKIRSAENLIENICTSTPQ